MPEPFAWPQNLLCEYPPALFPAPARQPRLVRVGTGKLRIFRVACTRPVGPETFGPSLSLAGYPRPAAARSQSVLFTHVVAADNVPRRSRRSNLKIRVSESAGGYSRQGLAGEAHHDRRGGISVSGNVAPSQAAPVTVTGR